MAEIYLRHDRLAHLVVLQSEGCRHMYITVVALSVRHMVGICMAQEKVHSRQGALPCFMSKQ